MRLTQSNALFKKYDDEGWPKVGRVLPAIISGWLIIASILSWFIFPGTRIFETFVFGISFIVFTSTLRRDDDIGWFQLIWLNACSASFVLWLHQKLPIYVPVFLIGAWGLSFLLKNYLGDRWDRISDDEEEGSWERIGWIMISAFMATILSGSGIKLSLLYGLPLHFSIITGIAYWIALFLFIAEKLWKSKSSPI